MSDPIEVLRATAPHSESPLPWRANRRFIEDSNGYDVGGMGCREDAAHIVAAVNAAPVLLAEVDRLRAQLAAAREVVGRLREWDGHPACRSVTHGHSCNCGTVAHNNDVAEARRVFGMGV